MFGIPEKIAAMVGGSLAIVLALALVFVTISKNAEINTLDKAINGKTGYVAQIGACKADRVTLRGNQATLEGTLKLQSDSIQALSSKNATLYTAAAGARADANEQARAAAAKAVAIGKAVRHSGNIAADADALILESIK